MSCFGVTVRDESLAERQGQTEERTEREELEIATVISFAIKGSIVMGLGKKQNCLLKC